MILLWKGTSAPVAPLMKGQGDYALIISPFSGVPGYTITPVDVPAVGVVSIERGVRERWDRWWRSRGWRFVDEWSYILRRLRTTTQSLIAIETNRPVSIDTRDKDRRPAQDWLS